MNTWASIRRSRTEVAVDEWDRAIFRKASLWATGVSYTAVAALLLAVAISLYESGEGCNPGLFSPVHSPDRRRNPAADTSYHCPFIVQAEVKL